MTRMFRRFARLLMVAGGCSLASWSLAGTPAASPTTVVATMNVTPAQARLEAMKVEVALLGDPASLKLPLTVSVDRDVVVLKGHVPDEETRRHVLDVARQNCYLPVRDHLSLPSAVKVDPALLKQHARDTLVRQFGSVGDRFTLSVSDGGQIKIEGDVHSVEEKLEVSRALRSVIGCTRIVNCLAVRSGAQVGQAITLISSDTQEGTGEGVTQAGFFRNSKGANIKVQPVETTEAISPPLPRIQTSLPLTAAPPRAVSVSTSVAPADPARPVLYVPPTAGYTTMPAGPSSTPSITTVPSSPTVISSPVVSTPVQGGQPGCNCNQPGAVQVRDSAGRPSLWDRVTAWKHAKSGRTTSAPTVVPASPSTAYGSANSVVITPAPTTTVTPTPQMLTSPTVTATPTSTPSQRTFLGRPLGGSRRTNNATVVPQSSVPAQPGVISQEPPIAAPAPGPALPRQTSDATQWPAAHRDPAQPTGAAPATLPTGSFSSRPLASVAPTRATPPPTDTAQRIPTTPPATGTQPVAAVTGFPTQTASTVVPATTTTSQSPYRLTEAELVQRVKDACGHLARGVRVEQSKDQTVMVHVFAQPASEHLLVARLLQVQELGARNVQLHVHMAK